MKKRQSKYQRDRDSLRRQAIDASACIPSQLLIDLGHRVEQGIIPIAGLRRFVDNPSVFLGTMTPLELARTSAQMAHNPQERASVFQDIIEVTHDIADLEPVLRAWEESKFYPQNVRDEVGLSLIRSYLACDEHDEAYKVVDQISPYEERIRAWLLIAEHTRQLRLLSGIRQLFPFLRVDQQASYNCRIALLTQDEADLKLAQQILEEVSKTPAPVPERLEWLRMRQIQLLLAFNQHQAARELAGTISNIGVRIAARCLVVQATKDEDDLGPLIFNLKDHKVTSPKALEEVIMAYLACKRVDLARRFADSRPDTVEQCLIFSLISADEEGDNTDLKAAEEKYRLFPRKPDASPSNFNARLQLIRALTKRGRQADAIIVAADISHIRNRVRGYLAIHRIMKNL